MKIIQVAILFFFVFFLAHNTWGQQLKEDEVVVIHGEKLVVHQVRTGETVYSICRDFQIDSLSLLQKNPKISNGLKIGEILQIPYRENLQNRQQTFAGKGDPTSFESYTISSRKETPYFIAKEFGITVEELYSYNPEHSTFKRGTKIRIPRWDKKQEQISPEPVSANQAEETEKGGFLVHDVISGETLFSISRKYAVPDSEILFYNPEAKNLKAGSKIYIPVKNAGMTTQNVDNRENTVDNYFEHVIESGETIWGITRKYNVTEDELKALNPALESSFPAGLVIRIPVDGVKMEQPVPVNENAFEKYTVQEGESLYGIASRYNVSVPEIKKYNPSLASRNLISGETILLPKKENQAVVNETTIAEEKLQYKANDYYKVELPKIIPESCKPLSRDWLTKETFTVALFLPLFAEINDTINKQYALPDEQDSTIVEITETDTIPDQVQTEDIFKGFYGNSENFLQFYEGVLLAIDSLERTGMHIKLNVYDTEDNPQTIRRFVREGNFLETDLIIGPVSVKVQREVVPIASKNRIPIVSPLVAQSDQIMSNSTFFQVNPDRNYINRKTAEMVAEEYYKSNFIVVRTPNYEGTQDGNLVSLIQEKLFNSGFLNRQNGGKFSVYDYKSEGSTGLTRLLSKEKENVLLIPTDVEGELSVAISNINNFAGEYSITLIAPTRYQQLYKSIEIEKFHNLKLQYISPFWTEYDDPETIKIIERFRENYYTEPNSFGMQGYDVAFYFLSALKNYGKNFEDCLPYMDVHLLQGNYYFDKVSAFGGYINKGVSVISYTKSYEVKRKRVEGLPGLANR